MFHDGSWWARSRGPTTRNSASARAISRRGQNSAGRIRNLPTSAPPRRPAPCKSSESSAPTRPAVPSGSNSPRGGDMSAMHSVRVVVIAAAIAVVGGCQEVTVPNYNNPSVDALTSSPTPSVVNTATSGLLVLYRATTAAEGWQMGSFGRDSYNLLQAEARNLLGFYAGPIVPGGFAQDLGWSAAYTNLRQIQSILTAVDKVYGYSAA